MVKLWSSKPSLWVRFPFPLFVLIMIFLNFFFNPLFSIFYQNRNIINIFIVLTGWFFNLLVITKENNLVISGVSKFELEKNIFNKSIFFYFLDFIFLLYISFKQHGGVDKKMFKFKIKGLNNNNFYLFNNTVVNNTQTVLFGLRSVWRHLRLWLLPLTIALLFIYYSFFIRSLPFSKVFFGYLLLANMFYLFISGFIFFFKKYQYRLYTSAIQRFWRRSLMVFWIIEGSLFSVFVYLIFNASQEPIHMYDNLQVYKTHLYSWRLFIPKVITSTFIILLTYILLLSLKWNTFTKTNNFVLCITVLILYVAWLEFYQLFHLMNSYGVSNWVYDFSEHLWNLELEYKRTRIINHYLTIGLVAKFWHIVFAVVFWVFFIFRGIESSRHRYPLLAANLQNFIIIYIMSWLYMYPWFKSIFRRGMDMPYFWFFINNRRFGFYIFVNDIKLYFFGFLGFFDCFFKENFFFNNGFLYYWYTSSDFLMNTQYRKQNIRDFFILNLTNQK